MTRQISRGTCTFCHRELSKGSMTRHLESCEQRIAVQGEIESRQKAKKIKYEYDFGSTTELALKVISDNDR